MIKDINLYKVIIGAYLHDMGKLLWRGGYMRDNQAGLQFDEGDMGPYHVAHAQFVRDFFCGIAFTDGTYPSRHTQQIKRSHCRQEIGLIASLHHAQDLLDKPSYGGVKGNHYIDELTKNQQFLAWCIYYADNISSSERADETGDDLQKKGVQATGLESVFDTIFQTERSETPYSYDPSPLSKSLLTPTQLHSFDFISLANEFLEKLIDLLKSLAEYHEDTPPASREKLISQLDILTQEYFSLVPSDATAEKINDLSLYDHTKIVVANSVILYKMYAGKSIKYETFNPQQDKACLIAGDFPGIQSYIHQAMKSNEKLAKRLRARSLIIQLLNEGCIQYILDQLELPRANVLLNAGGKFVILANAGNADHVQIIASSINMHLIQMYGSTIKFNIIADESNSIQDIFSLKKGEKIQDCFTQLFELLTRNKYQLYSIENLQSLFGSSYFAGRNLRVGDTEGMLLESIDDEIILGEKIVKLDEPSFYLNYKDEQGGFLFQFIGENDLLKTGQLQIAINNRDHTQASIPHCISKSLNIYVPKKKNTDGVVVVKEFDELIDNDANYLTMIKGDIDGMSLILKHGLGGNYSISRLVQFSRFLELFFGKITQDCLPEKNIFTQKSDFENIYTVFSGGDDFVFIVPFQQRISFIQEYMAQFRAFVANNDIIHFSVGMYLFKNKTPLRYVDTECEKILKSAKMKSKNGYGSVEFREDASTELGMYGVGLYDSNYVFDLDVEFEGEDDVSLDIQRNIGNNPGQLSDTGLYTIYSQLQLMRQSLQYDHYADYVTQLSKIYYMISKNLDANACQSIVKDLGTMDISDGKEHIIGSIDTLLLKIIHKVYTERGAK